MGVNVGMRPMVDGETLMVVVVGRGACDRCL